MIPEVPGEVMSAETPIQPGEEPQRPPRKPFSRRRPTLAFTVAALADGLSVFLRSRRRYSGRPIW